MTLPRIFSRRHTSRVEAERLRHENDTLQSALNIIQAERDHYKAENARFLDFRLGDRQTIKRLEDEAQRLRREIATLERERDNKGRFRCAP